MSLTLTRKTFRSMGRKKISKLLRKGFTITVVAR